ncbi:MAG: carbonic anhydrase, partial [Bradymonadaceae bacterium]
MDALVRALEENRAYTDDLEEFRVDEHDPHAVSVSCCDARVPQGRLFAAQPGEHFTVANIGNSVRARDKEGE